MQFTTMHVRVFVNSVGPYYLMWCIVLGQPPQAFVRNTLNKVTAMCNGCNSAVMPCNRNTVIIYYCRMSCSFRETCFQACCHFCGLYRTHRHLTSCYLTTALSLQA